MLFAGRWPRRNVWLFSLLVFVGMWCLLYGGSLASADADDDVPPIVSAAYDDNWKKVIAMAKKDRYAVNASDNEGVSILHMAAGNTKDDIVVMLLKLGADKNARDINQRRPYDYALENKKLSNKVRDMLK